MAMLFVCHAVVFGTVLQFQCIPSLVVYIGSIVQKILFTPDALLMITLLDDVRNCMDTCV